MHTNFFFNGSWISQLAVGFGLFLCSFYVEYRILIHFVSPPLMALFLAVTLESGKIVAIVWHYYFGYLAPETYPTAVRLTSLLFRVGLVSLSLLCSMLFFTAHLDRPNLTAVKSGRLQEISTRTQQLTEQIKDQYKERKNNLLTMQKADTQQLRQQFDRRINKLESLLLQEMDNVVNGVFKGKRYQEFERRLEKEKSRRYTAITALQQQYTTQRDTLDRSLNDELAKTETGMDKQRSAVIANDFSTSEQANDKRIVALLKTVKSIFHWQVLPLQFVFFFSILISLLMETGIMLSFATITIAIAPVLQARYIEALEKETLKVHTQGMEEQDDIRHQASMNRVRKAGKRAVEKATAVYSQTVNRA